MTTLILPGFSLPNKDWAETIKSQLAPDIPTEIYYWQHWTTGTPEPDWLNKETNRIIDKLQSLKDTDYALLAKSIGTAIAATLAGDLPNLIIKLILCGVPINDFLPGTEKYYEPLKNFPPKRILAIQNDADPHGSISQAKDFYSHINPEIVVTSKPGSDHEYPYSQDFKNFLKEK